MKRFSDWMRSTLYSDAASESGDDRRYIRERILLAVFIGATLLGGIAYIINLITAVRQGQWASIFIYSLIFGAVCALTLIRNIPYSVRASSLVIVLYIAGVVSALQFGSIGDARIWLLGAVILSGVFMGLRAGVASAFIASATYIVIGFMMAQSIIPIPDLTDYIQSGDLSPWISTVIPFFAISIMIVSSIGVLVNSLNESVHRSRSLADDLRRDQERLEARSQALVRRELQIRTAADISRAVIAELDPTQLFQRVVDLVQERFNLYYVGVFILDQAGHYAELRAGTGVAGQRMLSRSHRLAVGSTSMIGYAISNKEARFASDVGHDAVHFDNPDLPDTRSELALPMLSGGRVVGALTVQSVEQNAFDQDDIIVLQGVSDTLATAYDNANLFQQVQASLEEVQALHRQYLLESWSTVIESGRTLSYTYEQDPEEAQNIAASNLQPTTIEVPLSLRGQVIGNLTLEAKRAAISPQEQAFVDAVSQQTALALENVRLVEETQRSAQQERIVGAITEQFSYSTDIDSIIRSALQELGRLPNVSNVSIHISPTQENVN